MTYLGIDNGVTGTIGIIKENVAVAYKAIPVIRQQSYTKKKQSISRVHVKELYVLLDRKVQDTSVKAIIERPMVNSQRFKASLSAVRCLEALLTVLELLKIPYEYIDSKQWQRDLLPKGVKAQDLKKASMDIGIRLFPMFEKEILRHKDADGILIAEWARRNNL
jgi:hypothetical protein